jgi:hypothetical protein
MPTIGAVVLAGAVLAAAPRIWDEDAVSSPPTTSSTPAEGASARACSPRSTYTDAVLGSSTHVNAYWRLGDSTGTVACESVANHDGSYGAGTVLRQPGALVGDADTSVGLDGSAGEVRVESSSALNPSRAISIEAWVRPAATNGTQTILHKSGQYLVRARGGSLRARVWWSPTTYVDVASPPVLRAGVVTHVVVTYDGAAVVVYADGIEVARAAVVGRPPIASTTHPLLMGNAANDDSAFRGQLDEVAIYRSALPAADIAAHTAIGRGTGSAPPGTTPPTSQGPAPTTGAAPTSNVILAAGDIAGCDTPGDEATARILDRLEGLVATLGDHVYEDGSASQFRDCYGPTWGRHRARTRPSVGEHEYRSAGAAPYFDYWGELAGPRNLGYYSYDLPGWHVVVLNSNCTTVLCSPGSAQERWLRADLAAATQPCTLAYWSNPLFSSGTVHGPFSPVKPFWEALYDAGADVVLNGSEHVYERFAPQDPAGRADSLGLRQFTVGTGGRGLYTFGRPLPNSQVRDVASFGVLKLTLDTGRYSWQFVRIAGNSTPSDSGSDACH